MVYSFLSLTSCLLAILTLFAGFSQITALHLREEEQSVYWPHDDAPSGSYSGGSRPSDSYGGSGTARPNRSSYGGFSGGGPGSGK